MAVPVGRDWTPQEHIDRAVVLASLADDGWSGSMIPEAVTALGSMAQGHALIALAKIKAKEVE
jgi:hypothetical protein